MDGSWRSKGLNVSHQTGRNVKSFPSPSLLKVKAKKPRWTEILREKVKIHGDVKLLISLPIIPNSTDINIIKHQDSPHQPHESSWGN
jgi:hypothetical protein